MKKLLSILLCLVLLASLSCAFAEDTVKWGTSVVGMNDYTNCVLSGAKDLCEEYGWEAYEYSAEMDVQKQVNGIESAIASGLDGMFVQDMDFVSVAPILKKALDAGMLISVPITFRDYMDEYADHENIYYVYWDEEELGYLLASKLFENMEEAGLTEVYVIAGTQGRVVVHNRVAGFERALTEHPSINMIGINYHENDDPNLAKATAEDVLVSNPEVQAFFSINENMAWSVYDACEDADRTDIFIAACDYSNITRQMIADGKLNCAGIDGAPYVGTVSGAKILHAKLNGEPLETCIDWYDFENNVILSTNEIYDADDLGEAYY